MYVCQGVHKCLMELYSMLITRKDAKNASPPPSKATQTVVETQPVPSPQECGSPGVVVDPTEVFTTEEIPKSLL